MPRRVTLSGSHRAALPGSRRVGAVPAGERISVSVVLAHRDAEGQAQRHESATHPEHGRRRYVDIDDAEAVFGADPAAVEQVRTFAAEHHLEVDDVTMATRTVKLSGSVADMCSAFDTTVERFEFAGTRYRGRSGTLSIPEQLDGVVTAVLGIDDRPVGQHTAVSPMPASSTNLLTPLQVAAAYRFPPGDGTGVTVGIVEFGGGYRRDDLAAYAALMGTPAPQPVDVSVDGARNTPQPPPDGGAVDLDLEVTLDVEMLATLAPGARIVVYFAPNTTQGWHDAIATAITDRAHRPSVLTISWGSVENSAFFTAAVMQQVSTLVAQAVQMGITVLVSSGDFGSAAERDDGRAHVLFPASDPSATACGGTVLTLDGARIAAEVAWQHGGNASGGGISEVFDVPAYQAGILLPAAANPGGRCGRGVPDVAGHADAYPMVLRGAPATARGTSAVAPLWAALVARVNQSLQRRSGLLNTTLYAARDRAFNAVATGCNGAYAAGQGWDPCTGLGSPIGEQVLAALQDAG